MTEPDGPCGPAVGRVFPITVQGQVRGFDPRQGFDLFVGFFFW